MQRSVCVCLCVCVCACASSEKDSTVDESKYNLADIKYILKL